LIGFMGTGKSSVGRELSKRLGVDFVDIDQWIEEHHDKKIPEIFAEEGEARFRQLEKEAVLELTKKKGREIAPGGGAVVDPENLKVLKDYGVTVALRASAETIHERVRHAKHRPLLRGPDRLTAIRDLLEKRKPYYDQADIQVDTDGLTPAQAADRIENLLKRG